MGTKSSVAGIAAIGLLLGACGGDDAVGPRVTAVAGEELFEMRALGSQPGCVTCHSLTPDHVLVGPSLAGMGDHAGERVEALDAPTYLKTSIVDPDHFVLEGFESGKMPQNFSEILTEQQINALVEYLLEDVQ